MKNFTFKKGDVLKGLPYEDNTFDFVHMRLLTGSLCVDQWPVAIKELMRVTRPGGIVQLTEIDNKVSGAVRGNVVKDIHAFIVARPKE